MVTVRSHFNEKLDWILAPEDMEEKLFRARTVAQMDPTFPVFIRMACIEAERLVGLPEGIPDTIKFEELPDGIADTTMRQELRRIRNFGHAKDMQRVSKVKREAAWIQILEAVHPKEAALLTQIKDQTLFYTYPVLFDIMKELTGVEVDIPRELPKVEMPATTAGQSEAPVSEVTAPESVTPKKRGRSKKTEAAG